LHRRTDREQQDHDEGYGKQDKRTSTGCDASGALSASGRTHESAAAPHGARFAYSVHTTSVGDDLFTPNQLTLAPYPN
jgi:hypothetical protein